MNIYANYNKVIPRDLFNEAKLLKCFGWLCMKIVDNQVPVQMDYEYNTSSGDSFKIGLCGPDNSLSIMNIPVIVLGTSIRFKTTYNSKGNFPLFACYNNADYRVFNEEGEWDEEFLELCKILQSK